MRRSTYPSEIYSFLSNSYSEKILSCIFGKASTVLALGAYSEWAIFARSEQLFRIVIVNHVILAT